MQDTDGMHFLPPHLVLTVLAVELVGRLKYEQAVMIDDGLLINSWVCRPSLLLEQFFGG